MPRSKRHGTRAVGSSLLTGLALLYTSVAFARPVDDGDGKCLLWKVQSGKATVYLLGSVHVADAALYPLDRTIETAFQKSDKLVVEVNVLETDPQAMARLLFQKGMYPAGETLQKNVSKATLDKLKPVLKTTGLPLNAVSQQRPWLLSLMLTMENVQRLGYRQDLGIDKYFLKRAHDAKMPILELETASAQIDMLATWPRDLQELLLVSTIEETPQLGELMGKMIEDWKSGDADGLARLVRKSALDNPKLEPVMKKMFDDRNVSMTARIEKYLQTEGTYFVVTGAGHMVGKKGIVELLRDRDFEVVQQAKTGPGVPASAK